MSNPRVMIYYSPRLYSELFSSVLNSICGIEVIDLKRGFFNEGQPLTNIPEADILILSLDDDSKPDLDQFPSNMNKTKVLAFSPIGNVGLRKMPNSTHWEEITPFGLDQLIREVILPSTPRIPKKINFQSI
jgi:hypothetical protein